MRKREIVKNEFKRYLFSYRTLILLAVIINLITSSCISIVRSTYLVQVIPVILAASVPCGCPEIRIRLGSDIFRSVLCRCTETSFGVGVFVFLLHMIAAGIFGVKFDFNISLLGILLKLVIFYMGCSLLYELLYFLSGSPVSSIAAVVGVNFIFLAVMLVCNAVFHLSDHQMLSAFVIYECMETVVGIMLLHFVVRKKECL